MRSCDNPQDDNVQTGIYEQTGEANDLTKGHGVVKEIGKESAQNKSRRRLSVKTKESKIGKDAKEKEVKAKHIKAWEVNENDVKGKDIIDGKNVSEQDATPLAEGNNGSEGKNGSALTKDRVQKDRGSSAKERTAEQKEKTDGKPSKPVQGRLWQVQHWSQLLLQHNTIRPLIKG